MELDDAKRIADQMIDAVWDGVPTTMQDLRDALADADARQDDPAWQAAAARRRSGMASIAAPGLATMSAHGVPAQQASQDLHAAIRALPTRDGGES